MLRIDKKKIVLLSSFFKPRSGRDFKSEFDEILICRSSRRVLHFDRCGLSRMSSDLYFVISTLGEIYHTLLLTLLGFVSYMVMIGGFARLTSPI